MWTACEALCRCLIELGVSIDGGKDSLSMVAKVQSDLVKSPGQVTFTAYALCPDITKTVTPDIKVGISDFLLIYICNIHVLNDFLLIYICKLHWISRLMALGGCC